MIEICNAEERHISALPEIERAAAELFSELEWPTHLRNETVGDIQTGYRVFLQEFFNDVGQWELYQLHEWLHLL